MKREVIERERDYSVHLETRRGVDIDRERLTRFLSRKSNHYKKGGNDMYQVFNRLSDESKRNIAIWYLNLIAQSASK